jgi:hypothetical protein
LKQNDLSLLTRALLWLLQRQPDIENILVDPTLEIDDIHYFPESEGDYPGKGSTFDTEFKRDYLEVCWNRTPPPKRP